MTAVWTPPGRAGIWLSQRFCFRLSICMLGCLLFMGVLVSLLLAAARLAITGDVCEVEYSRSPQMQQSFKELRREQPAQQKCRGNRRDLPKPCAAKAS